MRARVVFAFTVAWIIVGIAPSVADEVPFKMAPPVSPLIIINHNPRHTGIGPIQEKWRRPTPFALLLPRI